MAKIILILLVLISQILNAQLKVTIESDQYSIRNKKYLSINIQYINDKIFPQVIFLQNWRLARQNDDGEVGGRPVMFNLINKLYLVKKQDIFENVFHGEDDSFGIFNRFSFKILKKGERFNFICIISDTSFINLINSFNYKLYYWYSYSKLSEINMLIKNNRELLSTFYNPNILSINISTTDINTIINYNFRDDSKKELDLGIEQIYKISDKFKVKLVELN